MTKPYLKIDIFSDVVCPWCYIGKRRLEKALDKLSGQYEFEIIYRPFELNPDIPKQGYDHKIYLSNKFGGEQRYEQITRHVTRVAAEEGLVFDFEKQLKSPNTLNAHRIIWWAGKKEKQTETVEAFFRSYFTDGKDLTEDKTLIEIAAAAGLPQEEIQALLDSETGVYEIKTDELYSRNIGVTGVPFYVINDKYGISGAQPSETFVKVLNDIGSEHTTEGPSCEIDGNC